MKIKVKLLTNQIIPVIQEKGDWIDLYSAEDKKFRPGESGLLDLGIAMQLPKGFEAIVAPRSSTFKHFGIICSNSFGIIDNSFCGDNDMWKFPYYSPKGGSITVLSRPCQFRIQLSQKATFIQKLKWLFSSKIKFVRVHKLKNKDRGGIGSTGK